MSLVQTDALTVSISTAFGVSATFHIITDVSLDDINQSMKFSVSSYINQAAYLSGLAPLIQGTYSSLSPNDYQSLVNSQGFVPAVYSYLATLSPFNGD